MILRNEVGGDHGAGAHLRASTGRVLPKSARSGFTMLEMSVAVLIAMIAMAGMAHSVVAAMSVSGANRETALASAGLRQAMETLQGTEEFAEIFARFNSEPSDDPGGAGTAPGANFVIAGLSSQVGDADGFVGEIEFPVRSPAPGTLILVEDIDDPALGMPRDLNGDGGIDGADHASDYTLLPVLVRARWSGVNGNRTMEVRGFLGAR